MSMRTRLETEINRHRIHTKSGKCSCGAQLFANPSPLMVDQHLADELMKFVIPDHAAEAYAEGFLKGSEHYDGRGGRPKLEFNPYRPRRD